MSRWHHLPTRCSEKVRAWTSVSSLWRSVPCLAAGIAASLLAGRLRLPGLVLVLVLGMVIGSDGLTLIDFHDYEVAQAAAVMALALILYEGGLSSGWEEIKPNIGQSIALATARHAADGRHHRDRGAVAVRRAERAGKR